MARTESHLTVQQLVDALSAMPKDWPVECQGTSVSVTPEAVIKLADYRANDDTTGEQWAFEWCPVETVVILTK